MACNPPISLPVVPAGSAFAIKATSHLLTRMAAEADEQPAARLTPAAQRTLAFSDLTGSRQKHCLRFPNSVHVLNQVTVACLYCLQAARWQSLPPHTFSQSWQQRQMDAS